MRNLKNVLVKEKHLAGDVPSAVTWDHPNDAIIYATGPTRELPVIHLKRCTDTVTSITSWDAECLSGDLEHDTILNLHHFSDIETTCLVLAGGDVVIVREDLQPGQEKVEIVGSVDTGISAAAWAPDEELLVILTRANTLILMSRDFETVTDVTLTAEDLKASKHVSVGWGKKETQFQGKRAKALRDPTIPETVDEGKLSPADNGRSEISWRGDGAFVAINQVASNRRAIRIFTRDAGLDSVSEPVDGMEGALSWRPSGNLLASLQRFDDHVDVIFFERNGLRHGQFSLRLSKADMQSWASEISLSWNTDSTVLVIIFKDRVQLWTMGNYHYYLKQEVLANNSTSPLLFRWHTEQPLRALMQSGGKLLTISQEVH